MADRPIAVRCGTNGPRGWTVPVRQNGAEKRHVYLAAGVFALTLTGCSTHAPEADRTRPGPSTGTPDQAEFLAAHDLVGMDGEQVVHHRDRMPVTDRSTGLMAAVPGQQLLVAGA